ncbi:Holo-[acyl-carrier-protein] synthase (fragment) [Candidatus Nitrosacidococcus tergens]|uniref:Holo-[acyl-carrier-protein] synthase n=1 Tax=Candidatus Nitrosacidococcus tergens TaxID=553981 RepID=A0A7G1Q8B6_9GAMM
MAWKKKAAELAYALRITESFLTLSDEKDYAVAFVILCANNK